MEELLTFEDLAGLDFPIDFPEISYDSPSPSSQSSDCLSLDSPAISPVNSPSSSHSSALSSDNSPSSSPKPSRHRTRCRTPHCLKKEHASILRRNERERNRVKLVSDGFATLRKHIPTTPANKKLSKVETLRTAIEYIKHLQRVLNESKWHERQSRFLRQVGWIQDAYDLQVTDAFTVVHFYTQWDKSIDGIKSSQKLCIAQNNLQQSQAHAYISWPKFQFARKFKKFLEPHRKVGLSDRPSKTVNLFLQKIIKFTPMSWSLIRLLY